MFKDPKGIFVLNFGMNGKYLLIWSQRTYGKYISINQPICQSVKLSKIVLDPKVRKVETSSLENSIVMQWGVKVSYIFWEIWSQRWKK